MDISDVIAVCRYLCLASLMSTKLLVILCIQTSAPVCPCVLLTSAQWRNKLAVPPGTCSFP